LWALDYNHEMLRRRFLVPPLLVRLFASATLFLLALAAFAQSQASKHSTGRTLVLPRTIVSGERATLAVLDANGRLVPKANLVFSNGDRYTTDATGRALFVAPLNLGVILGSIEGNPDRMPTAIVSRQEAASAEVKIESVPEAVSITDRLEIAGRGFCGDADANQVSISGAPAFVLASSPTFLAVLPPQALEPGRSSVEISCGKKKPAAANVVFVALELNADTSPLVPGTHRWLTVHARGTMDKLTLEAKNLSPGVAQLLGGSPARVSSSGGADNVARFEVVGRKNGSFLISIRLVSSIAHPQ
jgi:hypothetical protein